jgi:signal transduction histidine kinase
MDDIKLGIMPAESIEAAADSARQAADLGAMMLTYLGESIISTTDVDLVVFCESTFADLQKKSPENISFEHTTSAVPVPVKANPGQLRQVITNLYTNAVEAIGDREGVIRTSVCVAGRDEIASANRYPVDWEAEETLYGSFEITDNGSGIDHADLERIFDPFFTTRFTGRGLGLAVALGIIKNHDGGMTVTSELGKGSSFKFYLPLH